MSRCATLRSPHRITGFFSSSDFRYFLNAGSHSLVRYGNLGKPLPELGISTGQNSSM